MAFKGGLTFSRLCLQAFGFSQIEEGLATILALEDLRGTTPWALLFHVSWRAIWFSKLFFWVISVIGMLC